jgi:cyclomaltodextrinase
MKNTLPVWSDQARALSPGTYRHYKGGVYEVIGVARHSETLEELGVYTHDGQMWVRPIAMFFDVLEWEGKMIKRFEWV